MRSNKDTMKSMRPLQRSCLLFITAITINFHDLFSAIVESHVVLTFPPARSYALDFLNNVDTSGPCGMPRTLGSHPLRLLGGGSYNFTWNSVYPHQGGIRIELLNHNYDFIETLIPSPNDDEQTPNNNYNNNFANTTGPTTMSRLVLLPPIVCKRCVIRLIRQVSEWTTAITSKAGYLVRSCADVDIERQVSKREMCNNHGTYNIERQTCQCDRRYGGDACQHADECNSDRECNFNGQCLLTSDTRAADKSSSASFHDSSSRRECYCISGFFGERCEYRSDTINVTDVADAIARYNNGGKNQSNNNALKYEARRLADGFDLFWRILPELQEIEVIARAVTNNWLAIGFRSLNATADCKLFPTLPPTTLPERTIPDVYTSEGVVDAKLKSLAPKLDRPQNSNTAASILANATHLPTSTATFTNASTTQTNAPLLLFATVTSLNRTELCNTSDAPTFHHVSLDNSTTTTTSAANVTKMFCESNSNAADSSAKLLLHPMDCTDIVWGAAASVGNLSRVRDMYTRDRSTPRDDEFYGGRQTLTAATVFSVGSVTTLIFRRRLRATHATDVAITNAPMHVIFARGQNPNLPVHRPSSGLELLDIDSKHDVIFHFYRLGALQYHGTDARQRGATTINFFKRSSNSSSPTATPTNNNNSSSQTAAIALAISSAQSTAATIARQQLQPCFGQYKSPSQCSPDVKQSEGVPTCQYAAEWYYDDALYNGSLRVSIFSSQPNKWLGIGWSKTGRMTNSDIITAWVGSADHRPIVTDRFALGLFMPAKDAVQNVVVLGGRRSGDRAMAVEFAKPLQSNDTLSDYDLTNPSCYYLIFPVDGGSYNEKDESITKHTSVPIVSQEKVCFNLCNVVANAIAPTNNNSTTTGKSV